MSFTISDVVDRVEKDWNIASEVVCEYGFGFSSDKSDSKEVKGSMNANEGCFTWMKNIVQVEKYINEYKNNYNYT